VKEETKSRQLFDLSRTAEFRGVASLDRTRSYQQISAQLLAHPRSQRTEAALPTSPPPTSAVVKAKSHNSEPTEGAARRSRNKQARKRKAIPALRSPGPRC
jgi:hypothetical protein